MAVAAYNTDLTNLTDAESGTWVEMTAPWDVGDAPAAEADYFIQGSGCRSSDTNNKTGLCSGCFNNGSDLSGSFTDGETVALIWHCLLPGNACNDYANSGLRVIIGADTSNFTWWKAGGRDYGRNPYGGWQCYAVDPSNTGGTAVGSGHGGTYQYFGAAADVTSAISKGTMHGWDAIRYGRGEIYVEYGESGAYGTFAGIAQYNDYNDVTNGYNRFGLFQSQQGSYLWKGLLSLGTASNAVNFIDANRVIMIDDTPNTYPDFNRIEINNGSSVVSWENISFTALGTYAPGNLEVIDDADVTFDGCVFQGMGTFIFLSNSEVENCVFKNCKEIDSGEGSFLNTKILTPTVAADSYGLLWESETNPDGYLDNMIFSKGSNAHHALEFGVSAAPSGDVTITLKGMSFTGFNASDGQNDSVVNILWTSGNVTIQAVECSGTISYKSAGASVNVTQGVVTKVTVKDAGTGSVISGAFVMVKVSDGTNFPYQASVSITGSGTTATVTHSTHGLSTGDYVIIEGCNEDVYNGGYQITVTDGNTYTYTTNETIGVSPATGAPKSTFAFIYTTTDGSGVASDQRPITSNQPVVGWVRKTSSSPYYKEGNISDTVDSSKGISITVLLVSDE